MLRKWRNQRHSPSYMLARREAIKLICGRSPRPFLNPAPPSLFFAPLSPGGCSPPPSEPGTALSFLRSPSPSPQEAIKLITGQLLPAAGGPLVYNAVEATTQLLAL